MREITLSDSTTRPRPLDQKSQYLEDGMVTPATTTFGCIVLVCECLKQHLIKPHSVCI